MEKAVEKIDKKGEATADIGVSEEVKAIRERKTKAEAEMETIVAEIALAEIQKTRDMPETLKIREEAVTGRENSVKDRENSITTTINLLQQRLSAIETKEAQVSQILSSIDQRRKDAEAAVAQKQREAEAEIVRQKQEADDYINGLSTKVKELEDMIVRNQYDLSLVETHLADCKNELVPLKAEAEKYAVVVNQVATQHYYAGEKTSGQISDYHVSKSNQGWDIERKLKEFIKKLGV